MQCNKWQRYTQQLIEYNGMYYLKGDVRLITYPYMNNSEIVLLLQQIFGQIYTDVKKLGKIPGKTKKMIINFLGIMAIVVAAK